jgi:uncharacterized membrane protein HdeD (DUF308 family)
MQDEQVWKARFAQLMLARLVGLAIFLGGIATMVTDVARPGGWPQLGAVLAIIGGVAALLAPKLLKKLWQRH